MIKDVIFGFLGILALISCDSGQLSHDDSRFNSTSIESRSPLAEVLAIFPNNKRSENNSCEFSMNELCHDTDTYPYLWLKGYEGQDKINFVEVEPLAEGTEWDEVQLQEDSKTSLILCTIFREYVELKIIKYSDPSMGEENEWKYSINEDVFLKFGGTSSAGPLVDNVRLKAGIYSVEAPGESDWLGTVNTYRAMSGL